MNDDSNNETLNHAQWIKNRSDAKQQLFKNNVEVLLRQIDPTNIDDATAQAVIAAAEIVAERQLDAMQRIANTAQEQINELMQQDLAQSPDDDGDDGTVVSFRTH